jgi:transposase, IS5 family
LAYLHQAALQLAGAIDQAVALWQAKVRHYQPLIERIITQTERRVLAGEPVPASEKLVSLFEPHADIIRKGSEVAYGHKLNLTTGRSGLILDVVIETGNPADSERLLPMLERHIARYGKPPRQAAADGSYASRDNLSQAKAHGIRDMAFHKKAGISCLKRAYGLARCTWRGLDHFRTYVWAAVVAYNLALFARLKPT